MTSQILGYNLNGNVFVLQHQSFPRYNLNHPHSFGIPLTPAKHVPLYRTLYSKFNPLRPHAVHPTVLCTHTQRTGTVVEGIGTGASTVPLPLTLQQQQNQMCFANELAAQLLDVLPPSQRRAVHLEHIATYRPERQKIAVCSGHAPAKGNTPP